MSSEPKIIYAIDRHETALLRVNDAVISSYRRWRVKAEVWRARWAWTFGALLLVIALEIWSRVIPWIAAGA